MIQNYINENTGWMVSTQLIVLPIELIINYLSNKYICFLCI